jgi:hypothetical protein
MEVVAFLAGSGGGICELRGGEADCVRVVGFLGRGGGRGGRMRDDLGSCNESVWTRGSFPICRLQSEAVEFPGFLTGREGGRESRLSPLKGCGLSAVFR